MGNQASLTADRRFYELDLLRFMAAVEVMMFHYTIMGYEGGFTTVDFTALGRTLEYVYFGVEMLFVLSGFVILKTIQQKTALGFFGARFVRLAPTYWVCVIITALVLLAANAGHPPFGLADFLANLTMAPTAFGVEQIDGVYWTMEVQLVFYAWIFLVCLARQIQNVDKFLVVWLIASVFVNVFGGITFTKLDYLLLPKLSCYFIAGGFFFLIYQRGSSRYLWSMVTACYVTAITLALGGSLSDNPAADVVGNTLLFLLFTRMVTRDHGLPGRPWMITLFKMTYPLYLLHQQIGYVILTKLDGYLPKYLLLVLVVSAMLFASYVIAIQVDKWLMPPVKHATGLLLQLAGEAPRKTPKKPVQAAPPAVPPSPVETVESPYSVVPVQVETVRSEAV